MYGEKNDGGFRIPGLDTRRINPAVVRQVVDYATTEKPGTIVVEQSARFLYLVQGNNKARQHLVADRLQGVSVLVASGDTRGPTLGVGLKLGLPTGDIYHSCTPSFKAELVKRVQHPVVFVGDGVNDAPALAAADCGISVAAAHGAAVQTADVAIIEGGMEKLGMYRFVETDHRDLETEHFICRDL